MHAEAVPAGPARGTRARHCARVAGLKLMDMGISAVQELDWDWTDSNMGDVTEVIENMLATFGDDNHAGKLVLRLVLGL